jgi:hypothetical protein
MRLATAAMVAAAAVSVWSCGGDPSSAGPSPVAGPGSTDPAPAGVTLSVIAVDLGGHNVLATADVRGAAGVQFEWYFERGSLPEVVTTTNQARYVYTLPGFKDFTVRVTLADGRRALGSGAVVVE